RGLLDLLERQLEPQLRGLVHGLEQQLVAVDPLLGRLLERQQLVGAQVPLVVAGPGSGQDGAGVVVAHLSPAPLMIPARVARLMFPPLTTRTTFPGPARPASAAAVESAPAPSAITRTRSASVRTAAS